MWTLHEGFLDVVRGSWGEVITASNPIQVVIQKLKCLKICLKVWNKETFREIFYDIIATSTELLHIQDNVANLGDSSALFEAEIDFHVRLNNLLAQ
ncbi:hypothetical protein ACS0TY_035077 [Phlomoides rotata]